jgi:hypothetical protein
VNADEIRMLCAMGAKLWPSVSASFVDAMTEVELSAAVLPGIYITGHVDVLTVTGSVARGADWKTGRKDSNYTHQMKAYGTLIFADNPEITEVTITILWVRDGEIENFTMTRDDAKAWVRELIESVVNWDGVYRPGSHCAYCRRSYECPAANALLRRDLAVVADRNVVGRVENELDLMAPDEIVEVLEKADTVIHFAERIRDAIRSRVIAQGDIIGSKTRLTIETEARRELDTLLAWPVLEASGFDDEDFADGVEMKISRIEKRIAKKAGHGAGAGAVRSLKDALAKAGAVRTNEIQKLVKKRA